MEESTIILTPAATAGKKTSSAYADVLITLLAIMVMPVYLYGAQTLWLPLAAVLTGLVCELVCLKLLRRRFSWKDLSWLVTAMITVMLLPATAPVWLPCVSVSIAICVAKYPFGGTGKNIFNPAAVGIAFCALCWPEWVLRYPTPFATQGVTDSALIAYSTSPASILRVGGTPKIDIIDVLLGKFAGPMGVTCMIVLGACLLFLFLRRRISPQIVFSTFAVLFLFAVLFPRVSSGERASLIYEFCSGAFVFGVIFMANDPATTPKTSGGQVLFGLLLGVLVGLLRRFGAVELTIVYALLLTNVCAGSCDKAGLLISGWTKQWLDRRKAPAVEKAKPPEEEKLPPIVVEVLEDGEAGDAE